MTETSKSERQPVGFPVPDWTAPPHPPRTPMAGQWCRVEPLESARHAVDLFAALEADRDGAIWTYLPYGRFARVEDYAAWMNGSCTGTDPLFFAIVDERSERPSGVASYLRITPSSGSIEVGHIHLAPRLQRTVAATEAMYLMMTRAFELGYRRYEWKCDALNRASRTAAMRLGFSFEGVFRQATVYKARNRDTAWYAVIDRDWPALRLAFDRWLDPENFDEQGRQRVALSSLTEPLLVQRG